MQRLQRHDELRGRAVRIGDDVLLRKALDRVGVHFRHDQRHLGVVAPGRGIVDHDAALRTDLRRPFLGDGAARRHQADIGVGEVVLVERLHLQRPVAERDLGALAAARGECNDLVGRKAPLVQDVQHFAAHIARGTDDGDLVTHGDPHSFVRVALPRRLTLPGRGSRRPAHLPLGPQGRDDGAREGRSAGRRGFRGGGGGLRARGRVHRRPGDGSHPAR